MGWGLPAAGLILPHWNGPPLGYGVKRTDNGPELVAEAVRHWIAAVGARTAFIEPGSPRENDYIESFNARRAPERRDLLHPQGSPGSHRILAAALQRRAATQQPGIPAAGSRNKHRAKLVARLRYAPPVTQLGRKTINVLTFKPDHSVGPVKPNAKSIPYVVTVLKQPCSI